MSVPIQVTFRDMPVSDSAEAACWREVGKLPEIGGSIVGCHVTIADHRWSSDPGRFDVQISLGLEGQLAKIHQQIEGSCAHPKLEMAIRAAFSQLREKIELMTEPTQPEAAHERRARPG